MLKKSIVEIQRFGQLIFYEALDLNIQNKCQLNPSIRGTIDNALLNSRAVLFFKKKSGQL